MRIVIDISEHDKEWIGNAYGIPQEINTKIAEAIINAEPCQPEPHWIPVTENCDCDLMDNEEVLVFQKDGTINGQIRHAMFYDFNGKKKFVTWEEGITIYNVLAYMPLPEPYKGVTDGTD